MKIIILIFTLLFSQFTFSQSQSGWSTVTFANDRVFLFNRDDLKIEGNIPFFKVNTFMAQILKDTSKPPIQTFQYEFLCRENRIQLISKKPQDLDLSDKNSSGFRIFQKVCGISDKSEYWIHFFATSQNNLTYSYFFDLNSLQRTNSPISGIKFNAAFISTNNGNISNKEYMNSFTFSCSEPKYIEKDKEIYFTNNVEFTNFQNSICNGAYSRFVKNELSSNNSQSSNINIDDAKKKCSDLGFKSGTEGFGKCVLQLSK